MENKNVDVEEKANVDVVEEEEIKVEDTFAAENLAEACDSEDQVEEVSSDETSEVNEYIKKLENELEEANKRTLRTQADLENFRRRSRQEFDAAQKYRSQSLIEDLLPVLDNFHRALAVEGDNENTSSLIKGMEMIYRQLVDALKKEGLEEIEAEGQDFDPHVHQAVMQVEDSNFASNVVVEELQKGYKLKDRVIRPTMVKVNQ